MEEIALDPAVRCPVKGKLLFNAENPRVGQAYKGYAGTALEAQPILELRLRRSVMQRGANTKAWRHE